MSWRRRRVVLTFLSSVLWNYWPGVTWTSEGTGFTEQSSLVQCDLLKSWSRTLHKSVSSFKTWLRTCLLTCRTLSATMFLWVRKCCKSAQTLRPRRENPRFPVPPTNSTNISMSQDWQTYTLHRHAIISVYVCGLRGQKVKYDTFLEYI